MYGNARVNSLSEESVARETAQRSAFWHGNDSEGRPAIVVFPRNHDPIRSPAPRILRFGVFMVEKGLRLAEENNVDQFAVVYDRTGMTAKNRDM